MREATFILGGLLCSCGGTVDVELFFLDQPPVRDGTHVLEIEVLQGEQTIAKEVTPFDDDLETLSIHIPFGSGRIVSAGLFDGRRRAVMGGATRMFGVTEGESDSVNIELRNVPGRARPVVLESRNGRVSSETINIEFETQGGTTVEVAEDRKWPGTSSAIIEGTGSGALVRVSVTLDGTCDGEVAADGCKKTLFVRTFHHPRFPSPESSVDVVIDGVPPDVTAAHLDLVADPLLPDRPVRAIGEDVVAVVTLDFDEDLGEPPTALLRLEQSRGTCAPQVNDVACTGGLAVTCSFEGSDVGAGCEGTYLLELVAVDFAGNVTPSLTILLDSPFDTVPPAAPIEGTITTTCAGSRGLVLGGPGTVEAGAVVSVGGVRTAADELGRFSASASGQISIRQIDDAGNQSGPVSIGVPSCGG